MQIKHTSLADLYSYADSIAYTEEEETTLIGLTFDKVREILNQKEYETLEAIDKYYKLDSWEREFDLKNLKKALKGLSLDKQLELFYYLGQLQGQKEMWHNIVNKED